MSVDDEIVWLRRLLEDQGANEVEQAVASGTDRDFYVAHPPITADVAVSVDGTASQPDVDFTVVASRTIRFSTAPVTGANVTIGYTRQTFADAELTTYLTAAGDRMVGIVGRVYLAAVYAIDALMMGASTALDFGAGAENYNMTSVWNRLQSLRAMYLERADKEYAFDVGDEGPGVVTITDFVFDAYDPELPQYQIHYDDQDDPIDDPYLR